MALMALIVRYNTIVHPFTLADNRHYTFYVFRLLLRHPATRYLVIPIYFISAWAAITALGGLPNVQTPPLPAGTTAKSRQKIRQGLQYRLPPERTFDNDRGLHVSFVLVWLIATSLSVITAPLVEPRYFMVPWLVWRLHMLSPLPVDSATGDKKKKKIKSFG
ncbi:MAG: hypothetical protein Q9183_006895, partial [Haloplaca sp. 2 TL-2023]